ncbi:hypothetical protein CTAYLR_008994 [Chrysophaeum taylorii]|uniref:Dynein regulatory complex subunit 2 n=1 Tax=Chrysophaeum taylorii TaxID=2483200 RepID=A0AAD7URG8_9STRA|nr:hypothetical protein CTAYLR_008994 [Chrysophaeum taylorii]
MQLLLDFADKTRVVNIAPDASFEELERQVALKTQLAPGEAVLLAEGKPLGKATTSRGLTLGAYGIGAQSLVVVQEKLRGGALLGKPVKGRSKGIDFEEKFMRQREYDAQNQKYQAARNELKAKMEQEKANSRMNRLKIQNQWRKIMRLAKVESLRKGIEILSQNHERDVDRKDAIIQLLDRDLEEAEDQFQMALRSHLQNMDALIDLQDSRLLVSEQEFEQELRTLEADFKAEKEAITRQHAMETQELNDIMAAVEAEEQEREAEAKQEHEQLREEIRNRNLEEINMLRIHLDTQIEQKETDFDAAHLAYLEQTNQCTLEFKFYTKKDQELSKQIEIKIRKIERLQASLHHWRTKLAQNMKECSHRNQQLLEEKNKIQGHFQHLKSRMNRFRQSQARRLTELTQNAHACKAKLGQRIELAERILVLAELARKLETEQEKVIPFEGAANSALQQTADRSTAEWKDQLLEMSSALPGSSKQQQEAAAKLQTSSWTRQGDLVSEWCHLDNFLRKYNKVLLDKLAIEKERERLERENADLQSILKQYFDGVSVNENVMNSENPLLVVNGKLSINQPPPVRSSDEQRLTVVEANHMVETARVNTTYF